LAKRPEDRYQDMGEFAAALERLINVPVPGQRKQVIQKGTLSADSYIKSKVVEPSIQATPVQTPTQQKPAKEKKRRSSFINIKRLPLIAGLLCIITIGVSALVYYLFFYPVLLNDKFNNPKSGWPTWVSEDGEVRYTEDAFRMSFFKPGGWDAAWSPKEYSDFSIETYFCTTITQPEMGAGLHFRTGEGRGYLFWIYPESREYSFILWRNDTFEYLIPRTSSALITPADSGTGYNCLGIKVNVFGDSIWFMVTDENQNYQMLTYVENSAFASGHLGPSVDAPKEAFSPSPVETYFYYIKVLRYNLVPEQ